MQARLNLFGLSAMLVGCAAEVTLPTDLTTQVTPAPWASAAALEVSISDRRGKSLGSFKIALTKEPAGTCLRGTWFKAAPITSDLVALEFSAWWVNETTWP